MIVTTNSDIETKDFAQNFAQRFKNRGAVITLSGELGAGKTTFVQGFAQGLDITDNIISPTFILMRQHLIPNSEMVLFHIDLYRLEDNQSLSSLGISELITPTNILLIEWPERLKEQNFSNPVVIKIKHLPENRRQIEIENLPGD